MLSHVKAWAAARSLGIGVSIWTHSAQKHPQHSGKEASEALDCVWGRMQTGVWGGWNGVPGAQRAELWVSLEVGFPAAAENIWGSWSQGLRWIVSGEQHRGWCLASMNKDRQAHKHTGVYIGTLQLRLHTQAKTEVTFAVGRTSSRPRSSFHCPCYLRLITWDPPLFCLSWSQSVLAGHHSFLHSVPGLSAV